MTGSSSGALGSISRRSFLRKVALAAGLTMGGNLLAACGPATAPPPATTPSGAAAAAPTAAAGAAAPASGRPAFRVGLEAIYTGALASVGENWTNGFMLYLDGVGGKGGGRAIEVVKEDEVGNPQAALAKAKKLVEQDNVDILVGITSSADAYVVRDYIADLKKRVLIVGVGSATDLLTGSKGTPWAFRVSVCTQSQADPLGPWSYKNLGKRAVTACPDYAQGHEYSDVFVAGFKAAGGEVVQTIFSPQGTNDYGPFLTQIAAAKPDVVFSSYNGSDALNFVKQFDEFGLKKDIKIMSGGSLVSADILPAQGKSAVGIYTCDMWSAMLDNAENKKFIADYKSKYKADPAVYAVYGYDAAHMLVDALDSLQGDTSDQQKFIAALAKVKFASPRGDFVLSDNHDVIQDYYIFQVVDSGGAVPSMKVLDTIAKVVPPK